MCLRLKILTDYKIFLTNFYYLVMLSSFSNQLACNCKFFRKKSLISFFSQLIWIQTGAVSKSDEIGMIRKTYKKKKARPF